MEVSLSPDVILCLWLGLKALNNLLWRGGEGGLISAFAVFRHGSVRGEWPTSDMVEYVYLSPFCPIRPSVVLWVYQLMGALKKDQAAVLRVKIKVEEISVFGA